jgi:hypothetical protein
METKTAEASVTAHPSSNHPQMADFGVSTGRSGRSVDSGSALEPGEAITKRSDLRVFLNTFIELSSCHRSLDCADANHHS